MATTHALAGLALALGVLAAAGVSPADPAGSLVVAAGVLGGLLPDADLYAGHRRTLHYPVTAPVVAVVAGLLAVLAPSPIALVVAVAAGAFALHPVMDGFGGGLELRPWEGTSERAVYDHVRGRWIAPRRWIPYDGAPADLALASVLAVPAFLTPSATVQATGVGALAVSAGWVLLRRRVPRAAGRVVRSLPPALRGYLPERFHEAA